MLSSKVYCDGEQIIAQVDFFFIPSTVSTGTMHRILRIMNLFLLQGDLANCFYIVESGQVRITMKRSRVSGH